MEQETQEKNKRPIAFDIREIENGFVCKVIEVIDDAGKSEIKELFANNREELQEIIKNGLSNILDKRDEIA